MVGGKHALVVVACLFAGVGAWGATVSVTNGDKIIYATELFGPGHSSPQYPIDLNADAVGNQDGFLPTVVLTIPGEPQCAGCESDC